ncbi:MAG: hypothetical protein IT210_19780 [Armatimonadetes bacterium]|nr:hypothetical protein [Armatimonadota bacterium]
MPSNPSDPDALPFQRGVVIILSCLQEGFETHIQGQRLLQAREQRDSIDPDGP